MNPTPCIFESTLTGCPISRFWDMGDLEPQPAIFFFQNFADNYDPFVHTLVKKERGMNKKEKKKTASSAELFPARLPPLPPLYLFSKPCRLIEAEGYWPHRRWIFKTLQLIIQ